MRKKIEVTQTQDIAAAKKKWKTIIKQGPHIMHNGDLEKLGEIVFIFCHLMETKHSVAMNYFSKENAETIRIKEIADRLRERHTCIFSVSDLRGSFSFDVYFVFDATQKKIENIICAHLTVGMVYFLTEGTMLPAVLKKFMGLDNLQFDSHQFSEN